ncbi:hypothetical protein [Crocosphaera sp.]|uniref:hypothetical protein n=1 Tax=Crocosphaera sp. TaxID=2729996 RepID=UPI003F1F7749|nr:hypothetical protein [Crocosphaera sp.]
MIASLREFVANKIEDRGRIVSSEELKELDQFLKQGQIKLETAQILLGKMNQLQKETLDVIEHKHFISSDSYSDKDREIFQNMIKAFLESIIECILSEDINSLDESILNSFREYLKAVNHPISWYIDALQYIKTHHGLQDEAEKEVNIYIDYLISALS